MLSQSVGPAKVHGDVCSRRVQGARKYGDACNTHSMGRVSRSFSGLTLTHLRKSVPITAQAMGQADPPDIPKPRGQSQGGREWLQSILSRFGPVRERASNTTVLDFEKPLVELDNRIKEVR